MNTKTCHATIAMCLCITAIAAVIMGDYVLCSCALIGATEAIILTLKP